MSHWEWSKIPSNDGLRHSVYVRLEDPEGGNDGIYEIRNADYDVNWTWDSQQFRKGDFNPRTYEWETDYNVPDDVNTNEESFDAAWKRFLQENRGIIYVLTFVRGQQYLSIDVIYETDPADGENTLLVLAIKTAANRQPKRYILDENRLNQNIYDNYMDLEEFFYNDDSFMAYIDGDMIEDPDDLFDDPQIPVAGDVEEVVVAPVVPQELVNQYPFLNIQEANAENSVMSNSINNGNHIVNLAGANGRRESAFRRYYKKATANQLTTIPSSRAPIVERINHKARIVRAGTKKRGRGNNGGINGGINGGSSNNNNGAKNAKKMKTRRRTTRKNSRSRRQKH